MHDAQPECPPVVSIQAGSAPDLVAGHLGWGVLLDDATVIALPPLGWTTGRDPVFVLLASTGEQAVGSVERLGLLRVELLGTSEDLDACVAHVHLANEPRHRGTSARRPQERVERAMDSSETMWSALERLHIVPRGLRELQPGPVLGPVIDWEARLREDLTAPPVVRTKDEVVFRWCQLFGGCHCTGQWW